MNNLIESFVGKINSDDSLDFNAEIVSEDIAKITISDMEDFPAYLCVNSKEMILRMNLVKTSEVPKDKVQDFDNILFVQNPMMPLSNLSKDNKHYFIFGQLSSESSYEELVTEINMLSENAKDSFDDFLYYLKS